MTSTDGLLRRLARIAALAVFTVLASFVVALPGAFAQTGNIVGSIGFASGGTLPSSVTVVAYWADTGVAVTNVTTRQSLGWAYTIGSLPIGDYKVEFVPSAGLYVSEWWDDKATQATATPVTVTSGSFAGASPTLALGGKISGTIGFGAGGTAPDYVVVNVYHLATGLNYGGMITRVTESWQYSTGAVPAGDCIIEYIPFGGSYLSYSNWWQGTDTRDTATPVSVSSDSTTIVNPTLEPGGTLAGTISFAPGGTLPTSVTVAAVRADTGVSVKTGTATAASGWQYSTGLIQARAYKVAFFTNSGGYFSEWWQDQATQAAATAVTVGGGNTTTVSPTLNPCGVIAGTIGFAAGGIVPSYVNVGVFRADTGAVAYTGSASASAGWHYSSLGSCLPAGDYKVQFNSGNSSYFSEWWQDKETLDLATPVTVGEGATVTVNPTLDTRGYISGTIGFVAGGSAPTRVAVTVYRADTGAQVYSGSTSAASGWYYTAGSLHTGNYTVQFSPEGGTYQPEWWRDQASAATATPVTVSAETTTTVSPTLNFGGFISGTIGFAPGGTQSGVFVSVQVYSANTGTQVYSGSTSSSSSWQYLSAELPAGEYKVKFSPNGVYQWEWWSDQVSLESATSVFVSVGGTTTVSPTLELKGVISGTIGFVPGGTVPAWVYIAVYQADTETVVSSDWTDAALGWQYSAPVQAGDYKVHYDPGPGTYQQEWWQDQPSWATATPVNVRTANTTTVNPTLDPGGTVSGTIGFAPGGLAPTAVRADVYRADTGVVVYSSDTNAAANWQYSSNGLPAGDYLVQFTAFDGSYLSEWWQDQHFPGWQQDQQALGRATATPVSVSVGLGTTVSPVLDCAGAIAGTVGFAALPTPGYVDVLIRQVDSGFVFPVLRIDVSTGWQYSTAGFPWGAMPLSAGDYRVQFCPVGGLYFWEPCTPDSVDWSTAPLVTVSDGNTATLNPTLYPDGIIFGTISFAPGGVPPTSVSVAVYRADTGAIVTNAAASAATGWQYRSFRVPEGDYKVRFVADGGSYLSEWWQDQWQDWVDWHLANGVHVGAASMTQVSPQLDPAWTIAGTIGFGEGGVTPGSVCVDFVPVAPTAPFSSVCTDAYSLWQYRASLPAGDYLVRFTPIGGAYLPEWWLDQASWETAIPVAVVVGQTLTVSPTLDSALPGAPTAVTAAAERGAATVSFVAPVQTGGSAIVSYAVVSDPGDIRGTGSASPITVFGLTNGTAYTFTVKATNATGPGPASEASNSVTPRTEPGPPTDVVAIAGDAQATVSFTASLWNGGSVITTYTVTSIPGGKTGVGAASPITVSGLSNGTVYSFKVTATNAVGTGPASAASNSVRACGYQVSPTELNMAHPSGVGSVTVTTQAGCLWTAGSPTPWIEITSGPIGTGSGPATIGVLANEGGPRSGTFSVAGTTVTVVQAPSPLGARFVGTANGSTSANPSGPAPLDVTFDASGCPGANPIVHYRWEFGDGQVADTGAVTVSHRYDATGSYFVTLTVTDSLDATAATQRLVSVADVVQNVSNAFELQMALSIAATNGKHDIIRLAGGVYPLTGNASAPVLYVSPENNDLVIEGGWTPDFSLRAYNIPTVLQNDVPTPAGDDGGVLGISAGGDVTVDGVTIKDGNTTGDGGGLSIAAVGSITVGNSRVLNNTTIGGGGGLVLKSAGGTVVLAASSIDGNRAANGGGAVIEAFSALVYTNQVSGNTATASDGGLKTTVASNGELVAGNNTVFGNQSPAGGSGLTVAVTGTGGVGSLNIRNNIVFGNGTRPDVAVAPDCAFIAAYLNLNIVNNDIGSSEICPDYPLDASNVSVDFSGRGAGDIRLTATDASLIDQGTGAGVPAADFEGDTIPLDGDGNASAAADIGADEYNPANIAGPSTLTLGVSGPITTAGGSATVTVALDTPAKRDVVVYLDGSDPAVATPIPPYLKIFKGLSSAQATLQAVGTPRHGSVTITATDPSGRLADGEVVVPVDIETAPTLGALTPAVLNSNPEVPRSFTAVFSDANGYQDITQVRLLVSATLNQVNAISLAYDRVNDRLYLINDANTVWGPGVTPGAGMTKLANSQGTIESCSVTVSGNDLTLNVTITPKVAFGSALPKNTYLKATDTANVTTGWVDKGDWTILPNVAPAPVTVTPTVLTSAPAVTQIFTAVFSDANGYQDISQARLLINTAVNQVNAISLAYDRVNDKLYLINDGNTSWGPGVTPGPGMTKLANTQGTIESCSVTGAGNTLTLSVAVTPKAAFAAATKKNLYLKTTDTANATTGWVDRGDWTIFSNVLPTLGALTPSVVTSAPAVAQSFTAVYGDANGGADIRLVNLLINSVVSNVRAISIAYDRVSNKLYLINDGNTSWGPGVAPGPGMAPLANSQGTVESCSVTVSGNNLTLNVTVTPKAAFAAATRKNLYLKATDLSNATTGWVDKGNWTIF